MSTLLELLGAANNLDEPEPVLNKREAILGIIISFNIVSWACVIFRFYARFKIMKAPWWDDFFVLLSSISATVGAGAVGYMTNHGMGKHIVLLSADDVREYLRGFWIANATYPCSTCLIKLALLFQFLRVYDRGSKLWVTTLGMILITGLWGLAYGILAWFPTVPVDAYWDLTKPAARYAYGAIDVETFVATYESHAAVNMLLDAFVLAVAVPIFFKPGMRKNSYWGLMTLFIIGGIVNMLSIWRLQSIVETRATTLPTFDPTWYGSTPIVLSTMEVELAKICASLPVFWPVLKRQIGSYIMVTHEVKITREDRRWGGEDAAGGGGNGDEVELRQPTAMSGVFPGDEEMAKSPDQKRGHRRTSSSNSKLGLAIYNTMTSTTTASTGSNLARVTSLRSVDEKKAKELMF